MNKFFLLILPFFLFARLVNPPFIFSLQKDETANFVIYYKGFANKLSIKWTLYKNSVLNIIYLYNTFPRQITLFNTYGLNFFKIKASDFPDFIPTVYIKVNQFSDKIVQFEMYLNKKYNNKIKIDYKGKK